MMYDFGTEFGRAFQLVDDWTSPATQKWESPEVPMSTRAR